MPGSAEFPQVAAVVGVDGSQGVEPFDKHPPFKKERRMPATVALRHLRSTSRNQSARS